jgi:ribosome-associated protein
MSLPLSFAKVAIDKKAERVLVLDLEDQSSVAEHFVICSAQNDRHVRAIADALQEFRKPRTVEGLTEGRWVLLDYGDILVHVFLDPIRDFYRLEDLWSHARRIQIPSEFHGPMVTRASRLS